MLVLYDNRIGIYLNHENYKYFPIYFNPLPAYLRALRKWICGNHYVISLKSKGLSFNVCDASNNIVITLLIFMFYIL